MHSETHLDIDKALQLVLLRQKDLFDGGEWDIQARVNWLRCLDDQIMRDKDVIIGILSAEKHVSEHAALIGEYLPTRMLLKELIRLAPRVLRDADASRKSLIFGNKINIVHYEPLGVIGIISPFNFPFTLPMGPIVSALLGGNAVIWKPPPETPQINEYVFSALDRTGVLPFHMLPTDKEYGEALVKHPGVAKIHFTGSVLAGKAISIANAQVRFTPPTLELGGSNAAIVLKDADLAEAVKVILVSRFSGLNCNSIKRVFVVEHVWDAFRKLLEDEIKKVRAHEKIGKLPEREVVNFSRLLLELRRHDFMFVGIQPLQMALVFLPRGFDGNLSILKEETFCPILPVVKVRDEAEAILNANNTKFGLGATVFTQDTDRFFAIASRLYVGGVFQNDSLTEFAQPQLPFGGVKNSGWGYTHGIEGLLDFMRVKVLVGEGQSRVRLTRWLGNLFKISFLDKLHLYPWTEKKMQVIRKWIDFLIRFS